MVEPTYVTPGGPRGATPSGPHSQGTSEAGPGVGLCVCRDEAACTDRTGFHAAEFGLSPNNNLAAGRA